MSMLPILRRSFKVSLFLSTLVAAVAASQALVISDARAETAGKAKVAVGGFDGAKSDDARSAFIDALKKDGSYEVTDAEDIKASSKASAVAEAAKGLSVNVVITGKVGKGGLKLKVLNGADGKQIEEVEIKGAGAKLKKAIEQSAASTVAGPIGQAAGADQDKKTDKADEDKPAADEAKTDEDKPAEDKPADSAAAGGDKGLSPLDLTAGLRPMHRTFAFHQTVADLYPNNGFRQLLKYELPLGPVLFIDANWYPGSHFTRGPGEWLGITAGFEKGFATHSVYAEGTSDAATLKTSEQAFYAGARFRLPIGEHMLGASGTYGQHTFTVSPHPKLGPLVPDVKYSYVRVGLDGTFRFGDFMAGAHVGKRFVMDTGSLKTLWFPNVKTNSLEAGAMLGYRLVSMLDLVVGFDWLRYAFDFNPVPQRPAAQQDFVAGGAVDEYLTGYLAFRFHLPGQGEVTGGE